MRAGGHAWRIERVMLLCVAVLCSGLMAGCDVEECVQMRACCDQVEDQAGVGEACGRLIEGVDDPGSCLGVTRSVVAMLEEEGKTVPTVCKVGGQDRASETSSSDNKQKSQSTKGSQR